MFPPVTWQRWNSLLRSAAGWRPGEPLQRRARGELRGGIPAAADGPALEDFGSRSPHSFAGEEFHTFLIVAPCLCAEAARRQPLQGMLRPSLAPLRGFPSPLQPLSSCLGSGAVPIPLQF